MSLSVSTVEIEEIEALDVVEHVLALADWDFDRDEADSVQCVASTKWGDMGALFAVRSEPAAVHFSLTIDVKPRAGKHAAIRELVVAMNERLWLGHFDFWADENVVLFRHTLPLTGRDAPGQGEIHAVLSAAIEAAERFIPAFNFMVWAGKTPIDAIAAVLFETDGEA